MEVRKQAKLTEVEVAQAVAEYAARKGFRPHPKMITISNSGSAVLFSLTDDEEWNIDSVKILSQTLKSLTAENAVVFKKLIERSPGTKLSEILSAQIGEKTTKTDFGTLAEIKLSFFQETAKNKKDGLLDEDEAKIIKAFAEMGITIKPRAK